MNLGICSGFKPGSIHDLLNDVRWSGDELRAEAVRRSKILQKHIGNDENLFIIAHANSPSFFADLFAVWEVGGCAVCVNSGLTPAEIQNVVEFIQPRAVLIEHNLGADLDLPVLRMADEQALADPGSRRANEPIKRGNLESPALILFTSGTSGTPKGVLHSQRSILARVALNQAHIGRADLVRTLCVLPTHFGHGLIGNCLTPLLAGCDLFLLPGGGITNATRLGSLIDEHQISFMSSVPGVWKLALRVSSQPESKLKRVHIGSAPLSSDLWNEVAQWSGAREVVNMYGITETANWIGGASNSVFAPEDGLLGTVWGGAAAIETSEGEIVREGSGEILLRTPSLMTGYYKRPDLTSEVLRNGWYSTGDTGSIDGQGVLRMTGRNRYAINLDGIKIYPEELDLLFERHPAIAEACAFGVDDNVSGQTVAAAIRLEADASVADTEILDWARKNIRPEAVPRRLFIIDEIPKTDRGKLNRDVVAKSCLGDGVAK